MKFILNILNPYKIMSLFGLYIGLSVSFLDCSLSVFWKLKANLGKIFFPPLIKTPLVLTWLNYKMEREWKAPSFNLKHCLACCSCSICVWDWCLDLTSFTWKQHTWWKAPRNLRNLDLNPGSSSFSFMILGKLLIPIFISKMYRIMSTSQWCYRIW